MQWIFDLDKLKNIKCGNSKDKKSLARLYIALVPNSQYFTSILLISSFKIITRNYLLSSVFFASNHCFHFLSTFLKYRKLIFIQISRSLWSIHSINQEAGTIINQLWNSWWLSYQSFLLIFRKWMMCVDGEREKREERPFSYKKSFRTHFACNIDCNRHQNIFSYY